jgi:hypothetical protein
MTAKAIIGILLMLTLGGCHRAQKAPECKVLVNSMSELGDKLTAARKVVGATEVQPTEVADALRPFSVAAKDVANSLNAKLPTVSSLRKVASTAASISLTLSQQSAKMADFADQMKDTDAASKAVDENKQRVDKLEMQIKEICEADTAKCIDLSKVLARFPAPTDQTDVTADATAWTRKLAVWTKELSMLNIPDQELSGRVQAFKKGWQELGVAMARLVAILELGKQYEALTKEFNGQLERANKVIAEVNSLCAS